MNKKININESALLLTAMHVEEFFTIKKILVAEYYKTKEQKGDESSFLKANDITNANIAIKSIIAFTIELKIKFLLMKQVGSFTAKREGGHDLYVLFNKLDDDIKNEVYFRMNLSKEEFDRKLSDQKRTFITHRYAYEKNSIELETKYGVDNSSENIVYKQFFSKNFDFLNQLCDMLFDINV